MKKVRFTLMKEDAFLTDEQQKKVAKTIEFYNWSKIIGLIEIKSFIITNKYIDVEVEETSNQWHRLFSQRVCGGAGLEKLRIELENGNTRLFEATDVN